MSYSCLNYTFIKQRVFYYHNDNALAALANKYFVRLNGHFATAASLSIFTTDTRPSFHRVRNSSVPEFVLRVDVSPFLEQHLDHLFLQKTFVSTFRREMKSGPIVYVFHVDSSPIVN